MKQIYSALTDAELQKICQIIGTKRIKAQFQKNPKEFAKIRPGFRPATLPDEETISLVLRHKNDPFIRHYLEGSIEHWLQEISECCEAEESQGASHAEALVEVLSRSLFVDQVELFFRIADKPYTSDFISAVKVAVQLHKANTEHQSTIPETAPEDAQLIAALQEKVKSLEKKLNEKQELLSNSETACEATARTVVQLQQQLQEIRTQHSMAITHCTELENELEQYQKLAKYADDEHEEAMDEEYPYTSLCQVYINSAGKLALYRLADIEQGQLTKFTRMEGLPAFFGNREKLFWREGPDETGTIGVWQWNAIPNRSDPSTDYVTTRYINRRQAIEVIELSNCHSYADIAEYLVTQAIPRISGRKLFFSTAAVEERIVGLLCNPDDFVITNETMRLKESVFSLPQFAMSISNTVILAGRRFCRYMSLGLPVSVYRVRQPMTMVRDIILSRATKSVFRMQGLTNREIQHCQAFLKETPIDSILQEISQACDCSVDEAQTFVNEFISHVDSYLTKSDVDVATLSEAISRNAGFVGQCKQLLTAEWEIDNAEKQKQAQMILDEMAAKSLECQRETAAMEERKRELVDELALVQREIAAHKQLATEVEKQVADRISTARVNAAAFISEMAFAHPINVVPSMVGSSLAAGSEALAEKFLTVHPVEATVSSDEINDIENFIDELATNLHISGYRKQNAEAYAQTIAFCIDNHYPIICAHNADRIAANIAAMFSIDEVMVATVPVSTADCYSICHEISDLQKTSDEPLVVLMNGVFDGFTLNAFSQVMQHFSSWRKNVILLLSAEGVDHATIPCTVWERSMYIDGDSGLVDVQTESLHAYTLNSVPGNPTSAEVIHQKRKSLKKFAGIVSNSALLVYAKYLAYTDGSLDEDTTLQKQLLQYGSSIRRSADIEEILNGLGVDIAAE